MTHEHVAGWGRISLRHWDVSLAEELTVHPVQDGYTERDPLQLFIVRQGDVLVPRMVARRLGGHYHGTPGQPFVGLADEAPIPLWDDQAGPVREMGAHLDQYGGGLLEAPCGRGKTIMGLELARRLGRSTCVLVHKEFLLDQWEANAKKFWPGVKIGHWRGDAADSGSTHDIVVAMVQTVMSPTRNFPHRLYESFGTLVLDECHRYGANLWQQALVRFPARTRLGLTATPKRRDGMERIFFEHVGPIAVRLSGAAMTPTIYKVALKSWFAPEQYTNPWNGETNTGRLLSLLAKSPPRTREIVGYIVRAARKGRRVLVLTDRVGHVGDLVKQATQRLGDAQVKVSPYIGKMTKPQRQRALESNVLVATYQLAQEGLDVKELDTLFLATPRTSITQPVGRILRALPGKKSPVVVDFVDEQIPFCVWTWRARTRTYQSIGYPIAP